jgi:hypothetical protein
MISYTCMQSIMGRYSAEHGSVLDISWEIVLFFQLYNSDKGGAGILRFSQISCTVCCRCRFLFYHSRHCIRKCLSLHINHFWSITL